MLDEVLALRAAIHPAMIGAANCARKNTVEYSPTIRPRSAAGVRSSSQIERIGPTMPWLTPTTAPAPTPPWMASYLWRDAPEK